MIHFKKNLLIIIGIITILSSCGQLTNQEIYSRPAEEFAHGELTAAYVNYGNTNIGYDAILTEVGSTYRSLTINPQIYATNDEFVTDVTTQLNAGNGPDLFLLNRTSPLSFQKIARNGTYTDLTPYVEADSRFSANDFEGLTAGQIDGKQYLLPIAFSASALHTTEENLKKLNLTSADLSDAEGILSALEAAVNYAEKESSAIPLFPILSGRQNLASFWVEAFNLPVLDYENKEVVLDKEFYKRTADIFRQTLNSFNKLLSGQDDSILADPEILQNALFMLVKYDKSGYVYYEYYSRLTALEQTPVRVPMHSYQDAQTVGFLDYYAAINSHSKNRLLSYETARIIMDYPWDNALLYSNALFGLASPANKSTFQQTLSLQSRPRDIALGNDTNIALKVPADAQDKLLNEKVSTQVIDDNCAQIFTETMDDYIRGNTDDFDGCWENLMNRLTLYLTE